jgi:Sortase and related acyltransferases
MTENSFRVRPVEEKDFLEWLNLRRLLWDEAADEEHREEMIDIFSHPETQLVLVAEQDNGRLIGFLEASIRPFVEDCVTDHVGYLEGWYVEEEFRRRGVGAELVRAAERWARSRGCTEMASDSEIGNEVGAMAHQELGYTETSRLVHWRKDL